MSIRKIWSALLHPDGSSMKPRSCAVPLAIVIIAAATNPGVLVAQSSVSPSLSRVVEWSEPSYRTRDARVFGYSGVLRAIVVAPASELSSAQLDAVRAAAGEEARWQELMAGSGERLLGAPVSNASAPDRGGVRGALLGEPAGTSGQRSPERAGIWKLARPDANGSAVADPQMAVITQVPFSSKSDAMLNGYRIGRYATEGAGRTDVYAPPVGFIEVTRENQNFYVSENFQLRQFLTKNQADVWPKYIALDLRLIDKLELVLQELNAMGVRADRMHVMSGFRTPDYNGPGRGGRAALSRHTYGDAADVWVDSDGNGYMDDLNGDGVVDLADAQVMLRAVERVEAKYPELVGGAGLYVATGAHGPYIHIDVRGTHSRW
ncbi:MAG: hypothetical protein H0U67_13410 [Gemmatimonadetes bacterium]|nr:hypothetical protein [Gemmatimonadota bacterium]